MDTHIWDSYNQRTRSITPKEQERIKGSKSFHQNWNKTCTPLRVLGDVIVVDQAVMLMEQLFPGVATNQNIRDMVARNYFAPPFSKYLKETLNLEVPMDTFVMSPEI